MQRRYRREGSPSRPRLSRLGTTPTKAWASVVQLDRERTVRQKPKGGIRLAPPDCMDEKGGRARDLRYVLSMFERAHQALMMALLPGPVGVR